MTNIDMVGWVGQIHTGNCFDVLDELPENSVHAVVADGPYGLAFMGESWDDFEPLEYQRWTMQWCKKAKRALKPGGHLLSFSGTRTYHRMASGVEDADFDIRDQIVWLYGTGFPKGQDIPQMLDGDDAEEWDGFKTALKPSHEPIVVARVPLSENTVAENVQKWGTGALNIDQTRVPVDGVVENGRYPSNTLLDSRASEILDEQSGECGGSWGESTQGSGRTLYGDFADDDREGTVELDNIYESETGGASRFFYTSKANKTERTLNGRIDNPHPTVKPADLMRWLVTLVTAEDQIVLDPFAGSGTTCKAAKDSGREFIGIEKDPEYADIARARCGLKPADPELLAGDGQSALQSFAQAEQESES